MSVKRKAGEDSGPRRVSKKAMRKDVARMGQELAETSREMRDRFRNRAYAFRGRKRSNTVMTRLSDEDLAHIDTLVEVGLFESRSEAVAYLTHEGIVAKEGVFQHLAEKLDEIRSIRDEARALIGAGLREPESLRECPSCGKDVSPTAKLCPNCGKELTPGERM